ncbi:hypothetical protein C8R44DRAFT_978320 [Mycena epipterygia]|nr:hypothetical protein C8R44DRAFT_978320 [Mycena epipterygia]
MCFVTKVLERHPDILHSLDPTVIADLTSPQPSGVALKLDEAIGRLHLFGLHFLISEVINEWHLGQDAFPDRHPPGPLTDSSSPAPVAPPASADATTSAGLPTVRHEVSRFVGARFLGAKAKRADSFALAAAAEFADTGRYLTSAEGDDLSDAGSQPFDAEEFDDDDEEEFDDDDEEQ